MALDYKLHKATEDKIDSLVEQKLDLKRRETNLVKQIEQFQKDNKELTEEKRNWDEQKSLEIRKLKNLEKKAREDHKKVGEILKGVEKDKKYLESDKKILQCKITELEFTRDATSAILRRVKKERGTLYAQNEVLKLKKRDVAGLDKKVKERYEKATEVFLEARDKDRKAGKLLKKARRKNKEANGLKISLGIKQKALTELEASLKEQMRVIKSERDALTTASRELELKRRLLSKAYSSSDVEDLNSKVERMLASDVK